MWIQVYPLERWASILKMVEREVFHMNPKRQYYLSQKEIVLMVPNHEKKRDDYVNPCLSKSTDEY